MNDASGSDLNWFWKEWFYNNWKLDQAVTNVTFKGNDPAKGAIITIVNKDKLVMPVTLKIEMKNGTTDTLKLPFQIWERGGKFEVPYNSKTSINSVTIDPGNILPDINCSNNTWLIISRTKTICEMINADSTRTSNLTSANALSDCWK